MWDTLRLAIKVIDIIAFPEQEARKVTEKSSLHDALKEGSPGKPIASATKGLWIGHDIYTPARTPKAQEVLERRNKSALNAPVLAGSNQLQFPRVLRIRD